MLKVLLDKGDRMHEHMGDIRNMRILRKKEKKCQRSNTLAEMKTIFVELIISKFDTAEKRTSALEDI